MTRNTKLFGWILYSWAVNKQLTFILQDVTADINQCSGYRMYSYYVYIFHHGLYSSFPLSFFITTINNAFSGYQSVAFVNVFPEIGLLNLWSVYSLIRLFIYLCK